jgi:hypothetical protein
MLDVFVVALVIVLIRRTRSSMRTLPVPYIPSLRRLAWLHDLTSRIARTAPANTLA